MFLIHCFLWPHLPLLPLPIYLMTDRELPFIFLAKNSFIFILKISTCPLKSSLMLLEGRLPWLDQVEVDFLPSISFVFLSVRRSPSVSLRIYFWRIDTQQNAQVKVFLFNSWETSLGLGTLGHLGNCRRSVSIFDAFQILEILLL